MRSNINEGYSSASGVMAETDADSESRTFRRIRHGTTIVKLEKIKKDKEDGIQIEIPAAFTDATIEVLLNSSDAMLIVADLSSQEILACNEAVERKTNCHFSKLNFLSALFSHETIQNLTSGSSHLKNQTLEGGKGLVNMEVTPIHWSGKTLFLIKIKEQDETISLKEHKETLRTIENITGGIGHDLKNVLGILLGNLSLLECDSIGETREMYQSMIGSTMRGIKLLNRFIRYTSSNKLKLTRIDLFPLVKDISAEYSYWKAAQNIKLKLVMEASEFECDVDKVAISQVIQNLLQNAKDAMPSGGTITIRLGGIQSASFDIDGNTISTPEQYMCISIEDEGVGIEEANRSKIFQPEFTTKYHTEANFGLGLAVVKKIVENHNGHIILESKTGPDSFTKFQILLPKPTDSRQ